MNKKSIAGSRDRAASRAQARQPASGGQAVGSGQQEANSEGREAGNQQRAASDKRRAVANGKQGPGGKQGEAGGSWTMREQTATADSRQVSGRQTTGGGRATREPRKPLWSMEGAWGGDRDRLGDDAGKGFRRGGDMEGESKSRLIPIKKRVLLLTAERTDDAAETS
ncbi:hypothetical protein GGX14DRAFT_391364 [Mycena pura]|uniref:Uncharacterized protein n=1 Tax=Mycena pura TaxID=153505 RepID=A0AAD6VLN0_9AGAR|nr:hypothetical protein GGX14DRAFT_391364 [Mycena pura]